MTPDTIGSAQCRCGAVSIEIHGAPKFRVIGHCNICQALNVALPKHHGYWASQWAFMRNLFRESR